MIILHIKTHTMKQKPTIHALLNEVYEAFTNSRIYIEFTGDKFIGNYNIQEKFTVYNIS